MRQCLARVTQGAVRRKSSIESARELRAFPGEERPYQMLGKVRRCACPAARGCSVLDRSPSSGSVRTARQALRIDHQEQPAERILKRGVALFSESHQLNMEVAEPGHC